MTHPLVTLHGGDGVGKSTVGRELAVKLGAIKLKAPSPAFDALRKYLSLKKGPYTDYVVTPTARFMFYASAVSATAAEIVRALVDGPVVLDRYIQCSYAFHDALGVNVSAIPPESLALPEPMLSVLLTASPEVVRERILARQGEERPDAEIETNFELQAKVLQSYRRLAQLGFTGNFLPVEISTDGKTPTEVASQIAQLVSKRSS